MPTASPGVLLPLALTEGSSRAIPPGKVGTKEIFAVETQDGKVNLHIKITINEGFEFHTEEFEHDPEGAHEDFVYLPFSNLETGALHLDDIESVFAQDDDRVMYHPVTKVPGGKVGGAGL